jgi:hypothetical protein
MSNTQRTDLQSLLGLPAEFEVKGKTVRLHPTTLEDHAYIEREILSKRKLNPVKEAAEAVKSLPQDDPTRTTIIEMGYKLYKEQQEVTEEDYMRYMQSMPGVALRVFLSLRKDYPETTRAESDEICEELFNAQITKMTADVMERFDLPQEDAREAIIGGEAAAIYAQLSAEFDGNPTPDPTSGSSIDEKS